jgi:ubiquinol-cytochrome c reductase cytochrome c1 subunit
MIRHLALATVSALALAPAGAFAAGGGAHTEDIAFSFEGPFGTYDEHQLQRGLQVYTEVCSACHGLQYVPIRTLADEGGPHLPEDQVRAYAEQWTVIDKETGEERPATPADNFPKSALENAPDLSLMAKKRAGWSGPYGTGLNQLFKGMGGAEHAYSILVGYEENPACAPDGIDGFYYNTAFATGGVPDSCKDEHGVSKVPGSWIAMPPPLTDDQVTYADGHETTVHHMAEDVAAFIMWTAEPHMMARKKFGFVAVVFFILITVLLYLTNKRIWAPVKGEHA